MCAILEHTAAGQSESVAVRKFFRSDVESVESIGSISAVLEQIFFGLGKFFAAFLLSEAIAPASDPCRLNG